MNSTTQINSDRLSQLNPTALALAFGVAGAVIVILLAAVMGGMSGMMHGGGAGWMHGSVGSGPGYGGPMMAGGLGFFASALVCGFLGGALAGGVSAAVYNNVVGRNL
jgi:hypothetical protein